MKNVLSTAREVLADLAKLETPTIAISVAAQIAPIIALIAGAVITAAEVVPYELAIGLVAATVQKLLTPPTPAPAPAPVTHQLAGAKTAAKKPAGK